MTLKNTDNCHIAVRNEQSSRDMHDVICESGNGTFREKDGVCFITYKTETSTVLIRAATDTVKVRRSGTASSDISYRLGKRTFFEYKTPYGSFPMSVFTSYIDVKRESISIQYVSGNDEDEIINNMTITIRGNR